MEQQEKTQVLYPGILYGIMIGLIIIPITIAIGFKRITYKTNKKLYPNNIVIHNINNVSDTTYLYNLNLKNHIQ